MEGESELVAGYIVEFGGVGFALLALAEYSNIMFIGLLTRVLFFRWKLNSSICRRVLLAGWVVLIRYFMIWVRGVVPRFRYDLLMRLCWKVLLPLRICLLGLFGGLLLDLDQVLMG